MALTFIASTTGRLVSGGTGTITVPAGVTTAHLGFIVIGTDNPALATFTISGWTGRVANPTGTGNSAVSMFSRLGGQQAGDTISITASGSGNPWCTAVWYDTGGKDVTIVGTPWTRNGTSQTTDTLPSITTTTPSQPVILVATTRVTTAQTAPSVSPAATQDAFSYDATTAVGHWIGHITEASAQATGNYTATWQTASLNGVGVQFGITASGVNHTASPSDALGITGSVSTVYTGGNTVTDRAKLTDAVTVTLSHQIQVTAADSMGLTENGSGFGTAPFGTAPFGGSGPIIGTTLQLTAADSLALSDTVKAGDSELRLAKDQAVLSDSVTISQIFGRAVPGVATLFEALGDAALVVPIGEATLATPIGDAVLTPQVGVATLMTT